MGVEMIRAVFSFPRNFFWDTTLFENYSKCRIWKWTLSCVLASGFQKKLAKMNNFWHFWLKIVNLGRFVRNVEWDFFCDFQALWLNDDAMVLFLARLWCLFHFHLQYVLHLFTRGGIGCLWQRCGRCILRKIQQIVYSWDTRRFFQPKSLCYGGCQGTLQFFDADGTTCGYIISVLHLWYHHYFKVFFQCQFLAFFEFIHYICIRYRSELELSALLHTVFKAQFWSK